LREGAGFTQEGADRIALRCGSWTSTFSRLSSETLAALLKLGCTGEYEDRLTDAVLATDGPEQLAKFYYCLHNLSQCSVLRRSVHLDGESLATLVPISLYFEYGSRNVAADGRYLLSRFAYARAEGGEAILESPLSHGRVILHDRRAATLIHALARPGRLEELASRVADMPAEAAERLLTLLLNSGMLTELSNEETSVEDENSSLRSWEFHDLLFHSRSRIGRHDSPAGGTYRLVGQIDPPPALKPACSAEVIALDRPDLERLKREDPPFALVQDARRSIREYDTKPITLQQLGEFLYRVGRVIGSDELEIQTPAGAVRMEFARRPYPAGGAMYELELYLAISACENLAAGLYHYHARNHLLERISGLTADVETLLSRANQSTGRPEERLQVLIIVAARFQRMSWKYASMAYAAILKHVGVLFQTMYLVAAAMDLAPCAIGSGDADLFARAARTDYYDETSVGEFLLGSKRV
jgi:SagB-type dehydrogenase family enzyme